jgi:hypothetical protein
LVLSIKYDFQTFYLNYPFLKLDSLIEYFSIFGGLQDYSGINLHNNMLKDALQELIDKKIIEQELPFFVFDDPFRKLLIQIARGDGLIDSSLNRVSIGQTLGYDIIKELVKNSILYIVDSRELPIKRYSKQLIKKELRGYNIQNKLRFAKPIYKFWFAFVEPSRDSYNNIDIDAIVQNLKKYQYRLTYLVFEQLSRELLKDFLGEDELNCNSYWDRYSEFDIYCKKDDGLAIVGECKYTNRPLTKAELIKLEAKIEQSGLFADKIALFSKSGFSSELSKSQSEKLLLFELEDFRELLNTL